MWRAILCCALFSLLLADPSFARPVPERSVTSPDRQAADARGVGGRRRLARAHAGRELAQARVVNPLTILQGNNQAPIPQAVARQTQGSSQEAVQKKVKEIEDWEPFVFTQATDLSQIPFVGQFFPPPSNQFPGNFQPQFGFGGRLGK